MFIEIALLFCACSVTQLCLTFCDCSPPGYSVCGIFQVRVLKWVAISFSRGSFRPRDRTLVSCIAGTLAPAPRQLPAAERPAHPQKPASERRVKPACRQSLVKKTKPLAPRPAQATASHFSQGGCACAQLPGRAGRRGLKSLVPSLERERRAPQTSVPASGEEAAEKDAASGELPGCKTELRLRELEVCDAPGKGRSACGWAALG